MNIDREKIIKNIATLLALCLVVGGLTQIRKHNSMSLSQYASEHPEYQETIGNTVSENKEDADTAPTNETSVSDSDSTEILQNDSVSSLTGAFLNAGSMEKQRITYVDGFYYEPLSDNLRRYITGVSYPVSGSDAAVAYDDLRYLHIMHYDFDGNPAEGELICNESIASDLAEIFYSLYLNEYQLERVLLIDEYDGDDTASMEANNTSCFNYRTVDDMDRLSKHAYGLAVDINPFYNPYVTYEKDGSERISPAASIDYADRSSSFPYKIDENDLCYKLFTEHGFIWGGNWNNSKDYQHFQKVVSK